MAAKDEARIAAALTTVLKFRGVSKTFSQRIAALEAGVVGIDAFGVQKKARFEGLTNDVLAASLLVKAASAQIDVVLHAAGIIVALPYLLEPGELIQSVSLGAGNTGKAHDLETDRRVAEFKFIKWQGGSEAVRQNSLLVDLFRLATAQTSKQRELYLTGAEVPMKFLEQSKRDVRSALAFRPGIPEKFDEAYGDVALTVKDYWSSIRSQVKVRDLAELVPEFATGPELIE